MEAAGRARGLAPQDMILDILIMVSAHTMRPRGLRLVPRSLFACMLAERSRIAQMPTFP